MDNFTNSLQKSIFLMVVIFLFAACFTTPVFAADGPFLTA